MTDLQQLNKDMLRNAKESDSGVSYGMNVFIEAIREANVFNDAQPQTRRNGEEYRRKFVTVYFTWVTDNRLIAHIITDTDTDNPSLMRLCIPEAGYRLYANYKDGYQVNGGGYNKPFHILEAMVDQAKKHIDVNVGVGHWQDYIKSAVIS
tara:strand:+ start:66 stop:515 length:450 start_codon:yes stop_codon:yes gene_type:complete